MTLPKRCYYVLNKFPAFLATIGVAVCVWVVAETSASASTIEQAGYVALEHRQYFGGPQYDDLGQELGSGPTISMEPEWYYVSDDERDTVTTRLFWHGDPYHDKKTHGDIRELDWVHVSDDRDWELQAGISKVFWGVTESRHLVDIINQTDQLLDTDGEDKLGQPLLQYARFTDYGTLRFYYLPYFRKQIFGTREGRLTGPVLVDNDQERYTNSAKEWHPDLAVRYQNTFGSWDIALAHFHGTSREPTLIYQTDIFVPQYDIIDQSSLDAQYTKEGWLWKLEAMVRAGQGDMFAAASGGFEYSFYSINDSDADLGFLVEYHYDERDQRQAPATIYNHDLFVGTRLALNDIESTELLVGGMMDVVNSSQSYFLEFSTRLSDEIKLEIETRILADTSQNDAAYVFQHDDFSQISLAYYF